MKNILKPQELNSDFFINDFAVSEDGTMSHEILTGERKIDEPASILTINYTVKNNSKESQTFGAASYIYQISSDNYEKMGEISRDLMSCVYIDAKGRNGSKTEALLITLLPDEEITVEYGHLVTTKKLDSMLVCSLNPFGTDEKSAMAEVLLGYAK